MQVATGSKGTEQSNELIGWLQKMLAGAPKDDSYSSYMRATLKTFHDKAQTELDKNAQTAANGPEYLSIHGINPQDMTATNTAIQRLQQMSSDMYETVDKTDKDDIGKATLRGAQAKQTSGNADRDDQLARFNAQILEEKQKYIDEWNKMQTLAPGKELGKGDQKVIEEISKNTVDWVKSIGEGVKAQGAIKLATGEANVKYLEQTGQLSKNAAATQLSQLKMKAYSDEIKALKERLTEIASATYLRPDEKRLYTVQTQNQLAAAQAGMSIEGMKSKGDQDSQSALAGVHQFWTSVINDADDASAHVKSLMTQAVSSLNSELVKGMMGQKMDWGKAFGGLASSTLNSGLKQVEGTAAKALGLGGKRGDSPIAPMYVQEVNAIPGAATGTPSTAGAGGFLTGLLHSLHIPGFAAGGDPTGLALVGENGPELANFGGGGHVTSNTDLRKMLTGGGGIHVGYIDARGANAADVQMRVQQALQQVHAQSVQSSIKAQREMAARRPRSS